MSATQSQKAADDSKKQRKYKRIWSSYIVLQTEIAIYPDPRNKRVILDIYILKSEYFCFTINSWLTKLVWTRWLDVSLILNCVFMVSVNKNELAQYPAILTSRLINNTYVYLYTTPEMDSAFRVRWLATSEVISKCFLSLSSRRDKIARK